ncbi:MAG TPA: T9SS type A sorting domain-containing protein [Chitinophagales bacterium]|nr:T9SS type A sorting domain-containing protein [Chitinophagales bacterium]
MKTTTNCTIIAMIMALGLLPLWSNSQVTIGGVNLGNLPNYFLFYSDARTDANWQSTSNGYIGNVAIDGIQAHERTSGTVPYAGTIYSNDATLGAWQQIVDGNPGQAFNSLNQTTLISDLATDLENAFTQINALTATTGYSGVSSTSLNGLNTQNGVAETYVINVTSGFTVSSKINITGDASDVFILRWDNDANFSNGYDGNVKFQTGGAIVPLGGLIASNFIHVAGNINSSGGGTNPPSPYPQGPRDNNGTGNLITGGSNWNGGGFFTGYWLTTGTPTNKPAGEQPYGDTHALTSAIFVGGWYSKTTKFSMITGTSGVYVSPPTACNLSMSSTQVNVLCHGNANGSIDVTATGGQGTVTYLWNDGVTSQDRTGLAAGTYTVTATGAANCTATLSTTITEPASSVSLSMSKTDISTSGGSDGTATANPSGGTPGYTFQWSTGLSTQVITGLTTGTYTVTATDSHGCTASSSSIINPPNCSLSLNQTHNDVSCYGGNNGSITLTANGAQGTLSYVWNNGATTQNRSGLSAGIYSVTGTDQGGCSASINSITIQQPSSITISIIKTEVTHMGGFDGTAIATASGGTPGYSYLWSTGATTVNISKRPAGTYTITATDSHGCTGSNTVTIYQPTCVFFCSEEHTDVSCYGGNDGELITGIHQFTGEVTYIWNDGATTKIRTGLPAGTYNVTATDGAGCIAYKTMYIHQPASAVSVAMSKTDVTTHGSSDGTATVTASGGTPGYTYLWSNGATASTITNLAAGTYSVTVTDANGCSAGSSIIVNQPANKEMASGSDGTSMKLYPNPAQNKFSIEITTQEDSEKEYTVVVENMLGQVIYSSQGQTLNGLVKKEISLDASITNGVYNVHIIVAGNKEFNGQLVVQH